MSTTHAERRAAYWRRQALDAPTGAAALTIGVRYVLATFSRIRKRGDFGRDFSDRYMRNLGYYLVEYAVNTDAMKDPAIAAAIATYDRQQAERENTR